MTTEATLVLGMVRLTEEELGREDPNSSAATDTRRIRELAALLGGPVFSLSDSRRSGDPEFHTDGAISRRVVNTLRDKLGEEGVFVRVLGDYHRFHAEYLRKAYGSFANYMLPQLLKAGLVQSDSEVILPHLDPRLDTSPSIYAAFGGCEKAFLYPAQNPLVCATQRLLPDTPLNESLDKEHPFVCFSAFPDQTGGKSGGG